MTETTGDRQLDVRWTPSEVASIYAAAMQDIAAEQAVFAPSEADRLSAAIEPENLTPDDRERLDELEVELINEHLKGQEEADAMARHEELYGALNERELLRDEHRCGGHTQHAPGCPSCHIERYLNGGARSVALSMLAAEKQAEAEAER